MIHKTCGAGWHAVFKTGTRSAIFYSCKPFYKFIGISVALINWDTMVNILKFSASDCVPLIIIVAASFRVFIVLDIFQLD